MVTAEVMNSPQSQNEIVGATVIRKTIVEIRKTTRAVIRCQILKFICITGLLNICELGIGSARKAAMKPDWSGALDHAGTCQAPGSSVFATFGCL